MTSGSRTVETLPPDAVHGAGARLPACGSSIAVNTITLVVHEPAARLLHLCWLSAASSRSSATQMPRSSRRVLGGREQLLL